MHALSYNFVGKNTNYGPENYPTRQDSTNLTTHGNACAGLAAGSRNTSIDCQPCGCGVAPDASIAVLKVGTVLEKTFSTTRPQSEMNTESLCTALAHRGDDIHIYSNSWNFEQQFHNDSCLHDVIKKRYYTGRNGKGSIYVFPADPPGNGLVNNIYTIAVGDMGVGGTLPDNPQVNSAVIVSMFASGRKINDTRLLTETHTGCIRNRFSPCQRNFRGQSAANAMVAGVIALLLQNNPNLTTREVKHVLVESASHIGIEQASAFKMNGAGKYYHKVLGFGYPNVKKMIMLSQNFTALRPLLSKQFKLDVAGNTATGVILSENINKVEQVEFILTFDFERNDNVSMEATSPDLTSSMLFENVIMPADKNTMKTKLITNHFWGEDPTGNWTLRVFSQHGTLYATIKVKEAHVLIYGTGNNTGSTTDAVHYIDGGNTSGTVDNVGSQHVNHILNATENKTDVNRNIIIGVVVSVIVIIIIIIIIVIVLKVRYIRYERLQKGNTAEKSEEELKTTQKMILSSSILVSKQLKDTESSL
ncbi:neuroendocrine convertase 1-like [Dreissena polymorpha]|uniref:P/Homo B domain-containing protein n=1 Tax=Dreissena polymorpha TaxID=45954 RepID=A0A9D4D0D2_DREPO|nr:neuroendocrine convertase 1-like [Dreissena polymorpha]KAH3735499.1 hypothetical protein DPMN_042032 [Dreissena polymorpha]